METLSIYIETSVLSYFVSRPSRDLIIAAHQQITREFWDNILPKYEAFISTLVIEETSKGDPEAARLRIEEINNFQVLEVIEEVDELANLYYSRIQIPEKAEPMLIISP